MAGRPPYRRAGGNGSLARAAERFWTDRHDARVRKGTRHSGRMKEESPGFSQGECQQKFLGLALATLPNFVLFLSRTGQLTLPTGKKFPLPTIDADFSCAR